MMLLCLIFLFPFGLELYHLRLILHLISDGGQKPKFLSSISLYGLRL